MPYIENILLGLLEFYGLALIVYVLMSWIPDSGEGLLHDLREVLASICDPYLKLFKVIPPLGGVIDISPIFAILGLQVLSYLVALLF